jgi:murein tripeptide amidase MpaA
VADSYLTVADIDASLASLAAEFSETVGLIELPFPSVEGRKVKALKLGGGDEAATMLLTGGVHAREWVPPDALVYLAADLLEALRDNTGLRYGQTYFDAQTVSSIFDAGLVVVPCANPDGRHHSQTVYPLWRGNRRVVVQGGTESYGVDLNRNFDFLWDYHRCFHPSVDPASDDPFLHRQTYHGPAPASEPETRNIVSLYDRFPIKLMVDVHSAVPCLLRSWGNDENQSADTQMNFQNALFDGVRGVLQDQAYREFLEATDESAAKAILTTARAAIKGVRNVDYFESPGWELYPTSGAGDDYAFSRHWRIDGAPKILAFTMECGAEFQPDFPEAAEVMKEAAAGLISICTTSQQMS